MELIPFKIQTNKLSLAGFKNQITEGEPVIAIHGWLDNAASFIPLAELWSLDRPFYAVEMPGHGWSEHRPDSASYHLVDNVVDVVAFIETVLESINTNSETKVSTVTLLGHSLGGIVSAFLAASMPEKVSKLILLDSLGPLTDEIENVLPQLRKAVAKAAQVKQSKMTVYPSKEMAARVRMMGVGKVSKDAAMMLVERGAKEVEGGYIWRSDPKLLAPSMVRFTENQVQAILQGIECPSFLICGKKGYFSNAEQTSSRVSYFRNVKRYEVEGGHHFHMDGDVRKTMELIDEIVKQ